MHLRHASEIFFDVPCRLPDILVGGGSPPDFALTATGGGRTVASLTTRHLVAALRARCEAALRTCLESGERDVRPKMVRLERASPMPCGALRLTGWVEHVRDDTVTISARAHDGLRVRCEATIELETIAAACAVAAPQAVLMRA